MAGELALTFQEQITQKHNEGVALDKQLRDTLLRKLERTREVGVLLTAAEKDLSYTEWQKLKSKLPFDSQA